MPDKATSALNTEEAQLQSLRSLPRQSVRDAIRQGRYAGQTAGLGMGYLQGNLAILPSNYALDFFRFCQRNPKPCPLIGVSDTGNPYLTTLGNDIDIRSDVPRYNVYRSGKLEEQPTQIFNLWNDDLVAFVLGCSFSFEEALIAEGIPLRHIEEKKTVAMYRTNIETVPAGPFKGPLVASMRPMRPDDVIRACAITARFPQAHGQPIHIGDPAQIGIADISLPDWGDAIRIAPGEVPVFWACGVTPQVALENARPDLCITHDPGCMLITDIRCEAAGH